MSLKDKVDEIFADYLAGRGVKKKVAALIPELDITQVDILVDKIESIGDVDLYVNDQETNAPAEKFFAFVDLISALILLLGPEAVNKAISREDGKSPYIPWLKKFLVDERFHQQIKQQLPTKYQ